MGYQRLCHEARYQFDSRGVHIERTPVYHLVAANTFHRAWRIAELNDIPVPPYLLPVLERATGFLMLLVKPDLSIPMIGDANHLSLTGRKADLSPHEGMNLACNPSDLNDLGAFFATACRRGKGPEQRGSSNPEAGYYVFRGGSDPRDCCLLLTDTQVGRGASVAHSYRDAAHL